MGLCASTETEGINNRSQSHLNRKTTTDAMDLTEKAIEIILEAKKNRRMVVADTMDVLESDVVLPEIRKSADQRKFLTKSLLDNFFLFGEMDAASQEKMIDALEPTGASVREVIIKQGDQGDFIYIIETGKYEVLIDSTKVKSMQKGMVFGELALMYQAPRAATVRCVSAGNLWKVERKVFSCITRNHSMAEAKNSLARIANIEIFKNLTTGQQQAIADACARRNYKKGEKILNQGDEPSAFFVIESGSVACIDRSGKSADIVLNAGQYFGELALMSNDKRKRDVLCREDTTCSFLGKEDFTQLLGNLKDVLDRNMGLRVLETVELFKVLDKNMRAILVEAFQERKYAKNSIIIRQGDSGDSFFVVREGEATVLVDNKVTAVLSAGQYFGEGSLLDGDARGATVRVKSDIFRAFELKKSDFDTLLAPVKSFIQQTSIERKKLSKLKTIKLNELKLVRNLGQGTFGLVKLCQYNDFRFALKCLQKKQIVSYNLVSNIIYEKRMMEESDHPFVLKLVNTFKDKNCLYMLLEIVPGGELFAFLQKRGGHVKTKHACFIAACVVSVFEYIHSKDICYRDLKPENLMIDAMGYIKMVDFGFAKVVTDKTFTLCGTPEYMAPEILLRRGHNKGVDYWATGILIYECESGKTPFADYENYDNRAICQNILRMPLHLPKSMNKDAQNLIKNLLTRDPNKRFGCLARGCRDIKESSYFKDIDWIKLLMKQIQAPYVPQVDPHAGISKENFDPIQSKGTIEVYTGRNELFEDF